DRDHPVLMAGGMAMTPTWCMVQRRRALPAPPGSWTLHYSCRTRAEAAFLAGLIPCPQVHLNFDDESGRVLDLAAVVGQAPAVAHLYCCGPAPMLAAFEQATANWPGEQKHVEYFTPKEAPPLAGGVVVGLRRSGRGFMNPPGNSILEGFPRSGIELSGFSQQRICGARRGR